MAPPMQSFDIKVIDNEHESAQHLSDIWSWTDECYFICELNPEIHIICAVDLKSLKNRDYEKHDVQKVDSYFPLVWCQMFEGGRQWYTVLGHKKEHYQDGNFVRHLAGGVRWSMPR